MNLLVDHTVLLEERVNDFPLVVHVNLVLSTSIEFSLGVDVATALTCDGYLVIVFWLEYLWVEHIVNWL